MIQTVLFDLDGTIVDTNELIIQSFLHTFEGITAEPVTREHIVPNMGRPLIEQMVFFSGREQVDDLVQKYRAFNVVHHDELVREFPYVRETLAKLHAAGVKLGVVTSKIRQTTEMGLKLTGLYDYFGTIVTVDDVGKAKPDPEGIHRAVRELGGDLSSVLMVGDSHYDIEAAHNAGIPSVAVAWSLKGTEYLKEYHPTHIIQNMRDIVPIVGIEGK
ncbi:pyrophosphatase PpaX [Paenibacillus sp. MZ04-78.2]|uniref:pyrophosphatase PpaX n=1 Tax=Paenibacillus sp. MZ04-78.2 TaxID=2962034 RepID=UPI0020B64708|nr:pyrophosphatase PpaX [Paenibacillus sp. MZ04-78.2]MCP3775808.1 pyrophosphatase PpaX [Paenibacillus sp. MZ04-78.2]